MNIRKDGIVDKDFSGQGQHIEDSKLLEPGARPLNYQNDTNELKKYETTFPAAGRTKLGTFGGGK